MHECLLSCIFWLSLAVHRSRLHLTCCSTQQQATSRPTWNFAKAARWTFSCFSSRARIFAKSFSVATEGSAASEPNSLQQAHDEDVFYTTSRWLADARAYAWHTPQGLLEVLHMHLQRPGAT